ncbi:hypothetical protein GCM10010524_55460 [Streptomyces mexicanus]
MAWLPWLVFPRPMAWLPWLVFPRPTAWLPWLVFPRPTAWLPWFVVPRGQTFGRGFLPHRFGAEAEAFESGIACCAAEAVSAPAPRASIAAKLDAPITRGMQCRVVRAIVVSLRAGVRLSAQPSWDVRHHRRVTPV